MKAFTRELGHTGLEVSRIGLGLAAVGRPAYITRGRAIDLGTDRGVEAMRTRSHALLDAAYAAGVRYIDAARSYGRAEEFLGAWLTTREIAPGELPVGSKWGYTYTGEWRLDARVQEVKDLTVDNLRRQFAESRSLLDDHLRLYQIHSATLESGVVEDEAVLTELRRIKESGLSIGLTVTGPHQSATIDQALAIDVFDTVQATWNLFERSATDALERAHAKGLGVIVKEALANGRLTATGGQQPLVDIARDYGATPDAIALASVLDQPWADVVLSGAVTLDQLRSNLTALDVVVDDSCGHACATWRSGPNSTGRSAPDSHGSEGANQVAACLLAPPASFGAQPAVLVQVRMPLALVTADFASCDAGLEQGPYGVGVELCLTAYDVGRGSADISAIQAQPDAFHEVQKMMVLAQIGVSASSARLLAIVKRVDGGGECVGVDLQGSREGIQHLSRVAHSILPTTWIRRW